MWYSLVILLVCMINITCSQDEEESDIIVLDDNNFEHLTQASTGATTGDWLVMMTKDKKCSECDKIEKELRKVATVFKGRKNIAKLDPKNSRLTLRRFKISKKPTLLFFHLGYQWIYKGDLKNKKISEFVSDGFSRQNGYQVTAQLDSIDVWKEDFIKELKAAYKEKRLPKRDALLIVSAGILAGAMLIYGFLFSKKKENETKKKSK